MLNDQRDGGETVREIRQSGERVPDEMALMYTRGWIKEAAKCLGKKVSCYSSVTLPLPHFN